MKLLDIAIYQLMNKHILYRDTGISSYSLSAKYLDKDLTTALSATVATYERQPRVGRV